MLATIALVCIWILLGLPVAVIAIPWTIVTRDILPLYRAAMVVVRFGMWCAGIRVEAVWREPLDPGQRYIFLANHVSNLDPPILIPLLPLPVAVILKRSLMKIPVLGWAMKLAGYIPVDRDGRVESAVESAEAAKRTLRAGNHILSFPEGTRSRDGRLQPFKKGPFYMAEESGALVVPVSIYGTERMMKKGSVKIFPATAHVLFHAPISPQNYASREELMAAVHSIVASGLPEWMRD
jgi:1-acyl-sn-glycerol-3-phosphate acyltransferase